MCILYFAIGFAFVFCVLDKVKRKQIIRIHKHMNDKRGQTKVIDNVNIFYIEEGSGFPLVIIHGFMSSSIDFSEIVTEFAKDYKVIAVDLIGFGRSDKRDTINYSKKNMAKIVHDLMCNEGHESYNVLGHSMGGGVALNIAHYYPNYVNSLVLVDSVGCIDTKRPAIPPFLLEYIFKSYIFQKLGYRICLYKKFNLHTDKFDKIYSLNCCNPAKTLYEFSRQDDSDTIEGHIEGIKAPSLIIWGRHDKVTPLTSAFKFKENIKTSKLIIFEESGHMPYVEEKNKFIQVVNEFLKSINH